MYAQKRAGVRCADLLPELWGRQRCGRCPSHASAAQTAGQRKHVAISYYSSKCSVKIRLQLHNESEFLGVGWQRPNQGGSTILHKINSFGGCVNVVPTAVTLPTWAHRVSVDATDDRRPARGGARGTCISSWLQARCVAVPYAVRRVVKCQKLRIHLRSNYTSSNTKSCA